MLNSKVKKKVKDWLIFILIALGGFAFFYSIYYICKKEKDIKKQSINKHLGIDTAKIIKTGYLKGSYVIAKFSYNNKTYQVKDFPPSDRNITGMCYLIKFDKNNPESALINFTHPFFNKNEFVDNTEGIVQDLLARNILKFSYTVNEKEYLQFQEYSSENTVKKGNTFVVIYSKKDPQVAYIKLSNYD